MNFYTVLTFLCLWSFHDLSDDDDNDGGFDDDFDKYVDGSVSLWNPLFTLNFKLILPGFLGLAYYEVNKTYPNTWYWLVI